MKEFDAIFDSKNDQPQQPIPGKYPSHVSGFEAVLLPSGAKVFNIDFTLAEECKKMTKEHTIKFTDKASGTVLDDDGKAKEISLAFMAGKQYRSAGVFLTPKLPEGERWKNKKYTEFFSNMGVKFPTNKDGIVQLQEVEESDIIGLPAISDVQVYKYTTKDGTQRSTMRVMNVFPWDDGTKKVKEDIDVPF
jgi:CDP-glycerol glycerophosphotransferase (TagB/SpsB family)